MANWLKRVQTISSWSDCQGLGWSDEQERNRAQDFESQGRKLNTVHDRGFISFGFLTHFNRVTTFDKIFETTICEYIDRRIQVGRKYFQSKLKEVLIIAETRHE